MSTLGCFWLGAFFALGCLFLAIGLSEWRQAEREFRRATFEEIMTRVLVPSVATLIAMQKERIDAQDKLRPAPPAKRSRSKSRDSQEGGDRE